ncbi:phosphopentomutase [Spirochaetia bacterium]|nr:phosphopentomutase [Spirochaetia bacterium]
MARVSIVVLDSLGVGALPDAAQYGDTGANTLEHIVKSVKGIRLPNLRKLGLFNIEGLDLPAEDSAEGCFGRCMEKAAAKDTTNGHYEIAGLIPENPCRIFGDSFPPRIIDELERRIGTKTIGNYPASGTEIIKELGDEHCGTGFPIVYLAADSLMQIAMHEDIIPLKRQYEICAIARQIMSGDDTVSRIICRPFTGKSGGYIRTENRRDFAIDPPGETVLDFLQSRGKDVIAVGKIEDIFNRRGITKIDHTKNNRDGTESLVKFLRSDFDGLLFVNLVDFDMLYGHRRNVEGYAKGLEDFDERLPEILSLAGEGDMLIITADHGCDPTFKGTDHTREYTPLLVYGGSFPKGRSIGTRDSMADIAASTADFFGYRFGPGSSFLPVIRN